VLSKQRHATHGLKRMVAGFILNYARESKMEIPVERWDAAPKPYGTLPAEAETLKRIQQMRAEGKAFQSIAEALNAAGVTPRRGSRWHPFAVARILQREQAA